MSSLDTIYALSSGSGKAGVAVIRVSGPRSAYLLELCCGVLPKPRIATKVGIHVNQGTIKIDDGLVLWFPGPASFTGEDVAEFHLHGSLGIVRLFMSEMALCPGVRSAEPGEFTRRAMRNGKFDLVAAEGLADMLDAETSSQVKQALFHVDGRASEIFEQWRRRLIDAGALVEACIDFSDEEGVADAAMPGIRNSLVQLHETLKRHLLDSERGKLNREGVRVVLVGAPNAGKSSLLNTLSGRELAIVSSEAGTTRDVIEVSLDLDGVTVILSDTAGLRDSVDSHVERLGIERTRDRLKAANIVLNLSTYDTIWQNTGVDSLTYRIWTKADLFQPPVDCKYDLAVSSKTGDGIDDLLGLLTRSAHECAAGDEPALLVRERQVRAVQSAIAHIEKALEPDLAIEMMAEELRLASRDISMLIGTVDVEDLLDAIFSRFCIGK
ncbi:MAG: tRNA uridine-5-carboxymethylaminomethyl(34) synthesis GTPase MnmE [Anderseniella sp.]